MAVLQATVEYSPFKLLNVVKNLIHFNTSQREAYIQGAYKCITGCIFFFTGRWAYNWGRGLQTTSCPPFFLRDSRASKTRAGREKNEGLQTKPKLLNLCVALTMQNSDWLFHGNLSTSVKNAPATINTRHNHNLQNK